MKKAMFVAGTTFLLTISAGLFTRAAAQKVKEETKTGWSHKKKDAVIGGGAGAVTGALISKKHGKGALIGGAVGAGAGYLVGRHSDKKHPARKRIHKYKRKD